MIKKLLLLISCIPLFSCSQASTTDVSTIEIGAAKWEMALPGKIVSKQISSKFGWVSATCELKGDKKHYLVKLLENGKVKAYGRPFSDLDINEKRWSPDENLTYINLGNFVLFIPTEKLQVYLETKELIESADEGATEKVIGGAIEIQCHATGITWQTCWRDKYLLLNTGEGGLECAGLIEFDLASRSVKKIYAVKKFSDMEDAKGCVFDSKVITEWLKKGRLVEMKGLVLCNRPMK